MGITALTGLSLLGGSLLVGSSAVLSPVITGIASAIFSGMEEEGKIAYGRGKQLTLLLACVLIIAVTVIPFFILPIGWAFLFAVPTLLTAIGIPYLLESRPTYLMTAKENLSEISKLYSKLFPQQISGNWKCFDMEKEHSFAYFRRSPFVFIEKPYELFEGRYDVYQEVSRYNIPYNRVSGLAVVILSPYKKEDPRFDEAETDAYIYWDLAHRGLQQSHAGYKAKCCKIIYVANNQLSLTREQIKDLQDVLNTAPHPLTFF